MKGANEKIGIKKRKINRKKETYLKMTPIPDSYILFIYIFLYTFLFTLAIHRYVDNINCLLYSFLSDSNQIVEITFDEFDVQKTSVE